MALHDVIILIKKSFLWITPKICFCIKYKWYIMIELTFLSELMLVRQVNQKSVFSRTDSGDWFISTNIEKYEKHRKEKEERIKTLEESLTNMSKWVDSLSSQVDKQEQYSRHNCLLLHDIPENKNETIDDLCLTTPWFGNYWSWYRAHT